MSWYIVKCGLAGEKLKEELEKDFDNVAASMPIEEEKLAIRACRALALNQVAFFASLNPPHAVRIESTGHASIMPAPDGVINGSANVKTEIQDLGVFVG